MDDPQSAYDYGVRMAQPSSQKQSWWGGLGDSADGYQPSGMSQLGSAIGGEIKKVLPAATPKAGG